MFNKHVNAMFINRVFSRRTIHGMARTRTTEPHPSMQRLLEFAIEVSKRTGEPVPDYADVGRALGVIPAMITNWKSKRGVSKDGAILAEAHYGCPVNWILRGVMPPNRLWPFERVNPDRWEQCSAHDRIYVQMSVNRALDECEASRNREPNTG